MAESSFDVVYDGAAIADGRMLVRDLAPALLALGDLVAEASVTIYPGQPPAALSIKATEEGSFLVQLIVEVAKDFRTLFSGDEVTALVNLQTVLFGNGISLIALIQMIRGRKVVKPEAIQPGHVRLTLEDGSVIEGVPLAVYDLFQNIDVHRHAREVVAPLRREGVEVLKFQIEKRVTVELSPADVPSFDPPQVEPVALSDETVSMVASIASAAFVDGNKWRLSDGDQTFWAVMGDEVFLQEIDDGLAFRKGDLLRVQMRVVQSHGADGLHTDRTVLKVSEHIARPQQLRLDEP